MLLVLLLLQLLLERLLKLKSAPEIQVLVLLNVLRRPSSSVEGVLHCGHFRRHWKAKMGM